MSLFQDFILMYLLEQRIKSVNEQNSGVAHLRHLRNPVLHARLFLRTTIFIFKSYIKYLKGMLIKTKKVHDRMEITPTDHARDTGCDGRS